MKSFLEIKETGQLENTTTCLRCKLPIRLLIKPGCRISKALALVTKMTGDKVLLTDTMPMPSDGKKKQSV